MDSIKLQKYLSMCGVASRRSAEIFILEGKVTVNGNTATLGDRVLPGEDDIRVDGRLVMPEDEKVYIALNKPLGYVSTAKDDRSRKTVIDLMPQIGVRLYPVGRLDLNSEGLIILTNDGEITNKLTHPKHHVSKVYEVLVVGDVSDGALEVLTSGPVLDGKPTRRAEVIVKAKSGEHTLLQFKIYEGRNRQVRKLCELAELKVIKLKRTAIGKIRLKNLKRGEWRYLFREEIDYLKGL